MRNSLQTLPRHEQNGTDNRHFCTFTIYFERLKCSSMANATMFVTCSGGTYFDRVHYVDVHLPLALACWQRHGLHSAAAFFPRDSDAVDVSLGIYPFRAEPALHAAPPSAQTEVGLAGVPRSTAASLSPP